MDGAIYSSLTDGASRLLDLELDVSLVSVISELNESYSSRYCHTSVECVDEYILFSIEIHVNARIVLCSLYILHIYLIFSSTWFLCRYTAQNVWLKSSWTHVRTLNFLSFLVHTSGTPVILALVELLPFAFFAYNCLAARYEPGKESSVSVCHNSDFDLVNNGCVENTTHF